MAKPKEYIVKVKNWRKYQTRTDIKRMTYFRVDGNIFIDPKFSSLGAMSKLTWVYLLSVCTQDNTDLIHVNHRLATKLVPIRSNLLQIALHELQEIQLLSYEIRDVHVSKVKERKVKESKVPAKRQKPLSRTEKQLEVFQEKPKTENQNLVAKYCDLWADKHTGKVPITGKSAGIIKRLAKDLGEKRLSELLEGYFQMPDAWAVKRAHDLGTFSSKLEEVARFVDSGDFVPMETVRKVDQDTHHRKQNIKAQQRFDLETRHLFEKNNKTLEAIK